MVTHLACQMDILWLRGTRVWEAYGESATGLGLGPWTAGSCFKRAPPNTEPLSLSTALLHPSLLSQPEADSCCLGCTYIPLRAPTRLPQAKLQIPVLHSSFPMEFPGSSGPALSQLARTHKFVHRTVSYEKIPSIISPQSICHHSKSKTLVIKEKN